jgi:hypothetical protein
MEYETAGDPMSDLKWTRKSLQKISEQLARINIHVSKTTVGQILKKLGFSLKSNGKKVSHGGKPRTKSQHKDRDGQFEYIHQMRDTFYRKGCPVLSVDSKKKELIGNFKNPGTRYKRTEDLTNDHDYLTYALGKAALYGVLDSARNRSFVSIGQFLREGNTLTSSDTPEFAVESIGRWRTYDGKFAYPDLKELLILADAGGSNGYRPWMWKVRLQERLCNKYRLKVTVCHYPPGTSKWNPIEHRVFSQITKNWAGTPLIDYETVLKYTKSTTTTTGLKVNAKLVKKQYEQGVKASAAQIDSLNIRNHKVNPEWNYTISPAN